MRYPLLVARLKACRETGLTMVSAVRISARRDGFRRAGMSHPKAATDHPPTTFTEDQLELLLGEPNLVVEFI
ncbi:HI1506-related protein [Rhizobium halophytocola]|uniref:Mu-like prophage FluMu N-terminal domain-containing protein n=2 Tax=Rhizobium halophytocola TaxID=735519 RepID=A0ABS4E404_9HYPH|nr:HI1506-related protein [Rhizobium halophytocola]MBP1852690.1 hypothetical protein [Rhizobium halophytocola]